MAQGRKTGGRKVGTPNRSTADLRALIDAVADPETLVTELARLAREAEREETRLAAIGQLLDRRYGRATQAAAVALSVPERDLTEDLLEKLARLAGDAASS